MVKITLNMQDDVHLALKQKAKADRRSLSNYLACLLEDSVKDELKKLSHQPSKKSIIGMEEDATPITTTLTPHDTPHDTPEEMQTASTSSKQEQIKRRLEIWLDTYNISVTDHSTATFKAAKKGLEQSYGRELRSDEYNYFIFDDVQQRKGGTSQWQKIIK